MKRIILLILSIAVAFASVGCGNKVVKDVPQDMQKVEAAMHDAGVLLEAAPRLKMDAFQIAIDAYKDDKMSKESFTSVVKAARVFDDVLIVALDSFKELRAKLDNGESVTIAAIDAVTVAVKEALTKMGVD